MFRLICLCFGYFIGCIQWSYLIGRFVYKIDIREHGSGNAGSTNAVRTMGARVGLVVFTLDILKAAAAFMLGAVIFKSASIFTPNTSGLGVLPGLYAAFGVIIGHDFPFYLKFKGGKGMASTVGAILFMDSLLAWPCYALAIGLIAATKYVSVASLTFTAVVPLVMLVMRYRYPPEAAAVMLCIGALCWFKHKGNIKRLINGSERRFNFKKEAKNE